MARGLDRRLGIEQRVATVRIGVLDQSRENSSFAGRPPFAASIGNLRSNRRNVPCLLALVGYMGRNRSGDAFLRVKAMPHG
jgi:hypothetical protein